MPTNHHDRTYSLMIHGGAGQLDELRDPARAARYRDSIGRILGHGRGMLADGAAALDAVEACAALLEDDPLFNAGRGSVLNEAGAVEMDAGIMSGSDLAAGAVAAVHHIANPVRLARRLIATGQVMLVGEGAMRFADQCGVERLGDGAFLLPERIAQLERARAGDITTLDRADGPGGGGGDRLGTIGAVARDREGNLAAATSTGGVVNKRVGRVGDSPIIGAGVYADNESCAVSATGHGEDFIRTVLARTIAAFVEFQGLDAAGATRAGIDCLRRRVHGRGGVIVIDRDGRCAHGFTTPSMIRGWIEQAGPPVIGL
jgi:beta-aspartyl-peptidase (threonine type)